MARSLRLHPSESVVPYRTSGGPRSNLVLAAACLALSTGLANAADPASPPAAGPEDAASGRKEGGGERGRQNPAEALEFGETIEVIGTLPVPGLGTALRDVPASVQTFGGKEVDRQNPLSAADFLERNATSVSLNSGQGNPFQPDLNFRGFTASPLLGTPQGVSVFLDGVRVNEPFGDVVNWDLIPPSAIASIQLVSGSTPALGLNTLGGALALYTKSGSAYPGLAASVTGGSFGRVGGSVEAGGASGPLDGFVTFNYLRDGGWALHNPSRVAQLFAKGGHQTQQTDLDLSVVLADTRLEGTQTLPLSFLDTPREAYTFPDVNENRVAHVNLKGSVYLGSELLFGGSAYYRKLRSNNTSSNTNDAFELPAQPGDPVPPQATNDRSAIDQDGWGGALQLTVLSKLLGRKNQLALGAAVDLGDVHFTQESQPADFTADRGAVGTGPFAPETDVETRTRYYGVYATDTLALTDELSLTLSGRYNWAHVEIRNQGAPEDDSLNGTSNFQRFNPAVGLAWNPLRWLTAFANYNEGMRVPTPMELTCADPTAPCKLPNAFLADPPLKAVVSRTVEVGARGRLGQAGRWSAALFRTQLSDDILFINDPKSGLIGAGFFANVGDTRRQGLELGLGLQTGPVAWNLGYGFLRATFETPYQFASAANSAAVDTNGDGVPDTVFVRAGNRIPGLPEHTVKVQGEWQVIRDLTVGASLAYASGVYARGDENNQDANGKVPGYALVQLDASYVLLERLRLSVKVENLLDSAHYNFGVLGQNAFTGPGRTFGPAVGVDAVPEQFRAVGAPRGVWATLEYRFGGGARAPDAHDS